MSEYYINKELDQDQQRKIHRDDCKTLPDAPASAIELKYLGSYGSKEAAFSKARGFFDSVTFCGDCLTAH